MAIDPNATQDSVDQATANLNNAMNGIVQQHIDKSLLERTIQQASTVDTSKYTAATVLIFKNALAKAQTVDGDQHALQDQVDLANKTLMSAIEGLEAKVDKNELLENINIASEIDTSKLTQQQGSDLTSALKKAKEVAGKFGKRMQKWERFIHSNEYKIHWNKIVFSKRFNMDNMDKIWIID